jgi:hypothetical protein
MQPAALQYGRLNQLTNIPGFPHSPPQVLSAGLNTG